MDEQIVDLIRDQFKTVHEKIDALHEDMRGHVKKDEDYWKTIDEQKGQLRLIRWIGSGGIGTALAGWFYTKFGGH